MKTMHRNNMGRLYGREIGLPPYVGQQDQLYSMLYSSVNVVDYWDPAVSSQENHRGIFNFDFSTDGAVLVAACEGRSFLVFDPNNRKLIKTRRKAHSDCVNCVRFLDTRSFVTCSDDTTVVLWDLRFLKSGVRIFAGHTSWVKNIEYASSLGLLITSGFDGSVYSWNINNYSKDEDCKRLFYTEGLMRCKLTPDESKLVLSTSRGYLMVIHDLDLPSLNLNMDWYKAEGNSGSRLRSTITGFYSLFDRPKNRLEVINEFPARNDAENIASLQVHPHGWCIVSRNTSKDDATEWTCVHDIHTRPSLMREEEEEEEEERVTPRMLSDRPVPTLSDSSARTNPPHIRRWGQSSGRRRHRPYGGPPCTSQPPRANGQGHALAIFPRPGPGVSTARTSSLEDDDQEEDTDSSDSESSDVDRAGCSGRDCRRPSPGMSPEKMNLDLYRYFLRAQWNDMGLTLHHMEEALDRLGSDVDMPDDAAATTAAESDHQGNEEDSSPHAHEHWTGGTRAMTTHRARLLYTYRHGFSVGFEQYLRSYYQNSSSVARNTYRSQPRLIYSQQEPNVGRGFIKEQCFSADGRLIVSPCGNGVRLLAFDDQCRELCDCRPAVAGRQRPLQEVRELRMHPHVVLTTRFSPTHSLFVSGSLDGSVAFMTPSP